MTHSDLCVDSEGSRLKLGRPGKETFAVMKVGENGTDQDDGSSG